MQQIILCGIAYLGGLYFIIASGVFLGCLIKLFKDIFSGTRGAL